MILETTDSPPSFDMMVFAGSMRQGISDYPKCKSSIISDNRNCPPFCFAERWCMDKQLIAKTLKSRGLKKSDLARALGIANSAVTSLLAGTRLLKADEVPKAKRFLGLDSVPLKGFVGASATASYFELPADDLDRVPAPENTTLDTVAVEIRGDSLGAPLDRWLVYYDNVQRSPTKSLFNRLCVVGLPDGRVLIKKLVPSKQKGLFHLIPTQGEIITDVPVDWAAPVKMMRPR